MNKLFPGGISEILSTVAGSVLPKPTRNKEAMSGKDLLPFINPGVRMLASLGFRAMQNYNQKI